MTRNEHIYKTETHRRREQTCGYHGGGGGGRGGLGAGIGRCKLVNMGG